MYMCVSMYMAVSHMYSWCLWRSEDGIPSPRTAVRIDCESPSVCFEPHPGPLQKHQVLLTTDSSLQPQGSHYWCISPILDIWPFIKGFPGTLLSARNICSAIMEIPVLTFPYSWILWIRLVHWWVHYRVEQLPPWQNDSECLSTSLVTSPFFSACIKCSSGLGFLPCSVMLNPLRGTSSLSSINALSGLI